MTDIKLQDSHIEEEMQVISEGVSVQLSGIETSPAIQIRRSGPKRTAKNSVGSQASADTPSGKRRQDGRKRQSNSTLPKPNSSTDVEAEEFVMFSRKNTKNRRKSIADN